MQAQEHPATIIRREQAARARQGRREQLAATLKGTYDDHRASNRVQSLYPEVSDLLDRIEGTEPLTTLYFEVDRLLHKIIGSTPVRLSR